MFNNKLFFSAALAIALSGCAHMPSKMYSPPSGPTVWNFSDSLNPLAAATGSARLGYRDPDATGWGPLETSFGRASALKLPSVNGNDPVVMSYPAANPSQGYTVVHNSPPNGVFARDGYVSNYTLVMDILLPFGQSPSYRGLYQTDAENSDSSELFVNSAGGVGVGGIYNGLLSAGTWHRLAWSVQCALEIGGTGQISKFIDGHFVGGHYTVKEGERCRWALGPVFHLFTDDDGETGSGFLTSLMYTDRIMSMDEIAALGGPSGRGADIPGPVVRTARRMTGNRVRVIAHRANSGDNPENTLAGIRRAFDLGADIVELDVRRSADGVAVLMHDEDVRRTTDGSGPVSGKTFAELRKLDAGSWFDLRYAGERIPTLTEALLAAKGRGKLLLDVKGYNMGKVIRQAMKKAEAGPEVVWISQNSTLQVAGDYRDNIPGAPIIWSGDMPKNFSPETFSALRKEGVAGFDIDVAVVTKEFVEAAHAGGMFVFVYTILDPDTMLRMINLGVDGMETDYPAALNSLMPPR